MKVILLAAGRGKRFGKQTQNLPKCLIPLRKSGENLLSRYLDSFRKTGLKDVVIVCGYQKEKIKKECGKKGGSLNIRFVFNKEYRKGSLLSLYTAGHELDGDCLIMDADVYFPTKALERLLKSRFQTAFLIDSAAKSTGEEMMLMSKKWPRPFSISKKVNPGLKILGESVGFLKIAGHDAPFLRKVLEDFVKRGKVNVEYEEAYNVLIKKRKAGFEKMNGFFWTEMDFKEDLEKIKQFSRL